MFASFEGIGEFAIVAAFLFLTWAASAVLALLALVLAFSKRTRHASRGFATVGIVASMPFISKGPVDPVGSWPFLLLTLAPLMVAVIVFCCGRLSTKADGDVSHAA
jgi:hypothetical protein